MVADCPPPPARSTATSELKSAGGLKSDRSPFSALQSCAARLVVVSAEPSQASHSELTMPDAGVPSCPRIMLSICRFSSSSKSNRQKDGSRMGDSCWKVAREHRGGRAFRRLRPGRLVQLIATMGGRRERQLKMEVISHRVHREHRENKKSQDYDPGSFSES